MLKKLLIAGVLLVSACAQDKPFIRYCPNVVITPSYSRVTNFYDKEIQYKAEIIGYEGYCRYDEKTKQTKAVIAPIFEVSRHSDVAGKNVVINYYANTSDNQNKMMGRQPHSFKTTVEKKFERVMVTGDEIEVRIPNDTPSYQINLEIALTKSQYQYNQKQGLNY
jgi:hypothetical protein